MKVPISFWTLHATANKTILVDSGAMDNFIHPKLLKQLGLGSQPLERPWKIWNIDRMTNKAGALTHCVDLEVHTGQKQEVMKFLVTDLGGEDLILDTHGSLPSNQNSGGEMPPLILCSSPSLYGQ